MQSNSGAVEGGGGKENKLNTVIFEVLMAVITKIAPLSTSAV
jgi:hypothetical protein